MRQSQVKVVLSAMAICFKAQTFPYLLLSTVGKQEPAIVSPSVETGFNAKTLKLETADTTKHPSASPTRLRSRQPHRALAL